MPLTPLTISAQAARTATVPDSPNCGKCRVSFIKLVTLGTADGPASIPLGIHAVQLDAAGRYWVLAGEDPPLVFDSTGALIRVIGSVGRGPGEFVRALDAVPLAGDSMLVVDGGSGRATIIGPDLSPQRSVEFSHRLVPVLVLKWPDLVIGNGHVGTPSASGWPLHRLSFATSPVQLLDSFGPDAGELRPYEFRRLSQVLAASSGGAFWSADQLKYRITRWAATGTKLQTLERRPVWFSHPSDFGLGSPETPPKPGLSAMVEDDTGLNQPGIVGGSNA